jgi:hypothetical protein
MSVTTDYEFKYSVETGTVLSDIPDIVLAKELPDYVRGAAVETVSRAVCTAGVRRPGNDRWRGDELDTSCVLSVSSSGAADALLFPCTHEDPHAKSCVVYRGALRLVHTDACPPDELAGEAFASLQVGSNTDEFLSSINSRALVKNKICIASVNFHRIEMDADDGFSNTRGVDDGDGAASVNATSKVGSSSNHDGMTTAGKAGAAIAGIVGTVLFLLLVLVRRRNRRQQAMYDSLMRGDNPTLEESMDSGLNGSTAADILNDLNLFTWEGCDSSDAKNSLNMAAGDYSGGHFDVHHSGMDSHVCASALCPTCRPAMDPPQMVPILSESDTESEAQQTKASGGGEEEERTSFSVHEVTEDQGRSTFKQESQLPWRQL